MEEITCDFCGHESSNTKQTESAEGTILNLCKVCWSTHAGNMATYPQYYNSDIIYVMRMLAWCTNEIINEIRKLRKEL